jgi:aminoglycoside phosphotransferase family enzyme/predicted kinase
MTPAEPAQVVETHSAVVVFFEDRAYKVKKPVDLGFLDFRSRAAREAVCHREVELNRRLAPDVYLGVSDVLDPSGGVCDHLVVMRRMPADRRLSRLARNGTDLEGQIHEIAHQVAALHGRSDRRAAADATATAEATRARWQANTASLLEHLPDALDASTIDAVQRLADRYLDGRGRLFEARIAEGRAVDGHGDLLADDIFCLDDGPRILDCIEFDDALRLGDGLADAAFLAMDLEHLGRSDLARRFLDAYREAIADTWPASLEHHLVAYRAQVRAKVAAIRATQGDGPSVDDAWAHLEQAHAHLLAGRVQLVLIGGLPGTGKSTLASGLERELGVCVLRSDELRKGFGEPPSWTQGTTDFRRGLYAPEVTAATYERMRGEAKVALSLGESVVMDASWSDPGQRGLARELAASLHADVREIRCDLPEAVATRRLQARMAIGGDASDATPAIATLMGARTTLWPEAQVIDTSDASVALVQAVEHLAAPTPAHAGAAGIRTAGPPT